MIVATLETIVMIATVVDATMTEIDTMIAGAMMIGATTTAGTESVSSKCSKAQWETRNMPSRFGGLVLNSVVCIDSVHVLSNIFQ